MLTTYLTILTAVSILAPFVIEAIKKLLTGKQYDVQVMSAITTAVIALIACVAYMVVASIALTPTTCVYTLGTIFFSILGSLCGYDKVFSVIFSIFKKEA